MSTASSGQEATDSLNGKLTFEQDKNRIVGRDQDNKIGLLIGTDPFVVKIAKDGFDVLTAGDDDLIFNSSQNVFKIVLSGTATVTPPFTTPPNTASGTHSTTIAHGLAYIPAIIAFVKPPSSFSVANAPTPWISPSSGEIFLMASVFSDATNITFRVYQRSGTDYTPGSPTYTFKYYLLQETIS